MGLSPLRPKPIGLCRKPMRRLKGVSHEHVLAESYRWRSRYPRPG